jgi:hypothetical protein
MIFSSLIYRGYPFLPLQKRMKRMRKNRVLKGEGTSFLSVRFGFDFDSRFRNDHECLLKKGVRLLVAMIRFSRFEVKDSIVVVVAMKKEQRLLLAVNCPFQFSHQKEEHTHI